MQWCSTIKNENTKHIKTFKQCFNDITTSSWHYWYRYVTLFCRVSFCFFLRLLFLFTSGKVTWAMLIFIIYDSKYVWKRKNLGGGARFYLSFMSKHGEIILKGGTICWKLSFLFRNLCQFTKIYVTNFVPSLFWC